MTNQMQLQAFRQYDTETQKFLGYKACFVGPHEYYPEKMTSVAVFGLAQHLIDCDPTPEEAIARAEDYLGKTDEEQRAIEYAAFAKAFSHVAA